MTGPSVESCPPDDHDWRLQVDCIGDAEVPGGTMNLYLMRCRDCGAEREATDDEVRASEYPDDGREFYPS